MRRLLLLILAAMSMAGCVSSPGPSDGIEELHLFGLPVAVNLDNRPGADGVAVRVYASGAKEARGRAIRNGTLEVVLFDGSFKPGDATPEVPLRSWSFNPAQLKALESENRLGIGYELTLPWTDSPPKMNRVTVFARYTAAGSKGRSIISGPASITVSLR